MNDLEHYFDVIERAAKQLTLVALLLLFGCAHPHSLNMELLGGHRIANPERYCTDWAVKTDTIADLRKALWRINNIYHGQACGEHNQECSVRWLDSIGLFDVEFCTKVK